MATDVTPTRKELHSSVWTSPKSKENDKNNGFIDQSVLTYMFTAVTGALLLLIGLCLCLVCVCWKRHVSSKKKNIISSRSAVPLTQSSDIQDDALDSEGTSVYGYEVIDEAKMEWEISVIQNDSISVKSPNTNSGISQTDSDGYLNPFHPIIYRNSVSCRNDKNNVIICDERQYLELPEAIQCINGVQQRETCELVKNEIVSKDDHDDSMYEITKGVNCIGDQVIIL
ncbi:unnamed protein product [Mytilus coruscus]|uniref:Uncharacterized protein n=1 Tax=Mytilus coruscus TaxID=42192 RepID=A0A6J8E633_MYTCO|nr:unnamed protein product [Mytilus coruscus]